MRHNPEFHKQASNWFTLAACEGKEKFDTYELANKVARRHRRYKNRLVPYKCSVCGSYHIGNRGQFARRIIKDI